MKIALVGLGVTGRVVADFLLQEKVLALVFCRKGSPKVGKDLGALLNRPKTGIVIDSTEHLEERLLCVQPDVVIDFSGPDFLSENLVTLAKLKVNVVTAVAGYSEFDIKRIKLVANSRKLGVVMASNIACGGNMLMMLARLAAHLHSDYDFEIIEENRRNRKDSPSETARKIAATILTTLAEQDGSGNEAVPIHSVRAGDIAGRHKALICGKYDQLEICHTAFSRKAFADGAYRAAKFICDRTGYYDMKDVLRLEKNGYKVDQWLSRMIGEPVQREMAIGLRV